MKFNIIKRLFSETDYVARRRAAGLHVIDEPMRFRLLVCTLFACVCASLVYIFDLFTTDFVETFQLSAGDQSIISTVGVSLCFGMIFWGFVYDYFGPFVILAFAVVLGVIGSVGLLLVFQGRITFGSPVLRIAIFYGFLNTSSGLFDCGTIVPSIEMFPRNRGLSLGLAKVMLGLGGSVMASLRRSFFVDDIDSFFYTIIAIVIVVGAVCMVQVTLPTYLMNGWRRLNRTPAQLRRLERYEVYFHEKSAPMRRFLIGYVLVLVMIVYFAIITPVVAYVEVSRGGLIVTGVLTVVLLLLLLTMALPLRCLGGVDEPAPPGMYGDDDDGVGVEGAGAEGNDDAASAAVMEALGKGDPQADEPLNASLHNDDEYGADVAIKAAGEDDADNLVFGDGGVKQGRRGSQCSSSGGGGGAAAADITDVLGKPRESIQDPRYDGTLLEMFVRRLDVWLLFAAFIFHGGLDIIVSFNSSTIYVAKTGKPRSVQLSALYTAFLGVGSAVGRLCVGAYEAYIQHASAAGTRRSYFLVITLLFPLPSIIGLLGGVLILALPGEALLLPLILVYFEQGMFNAIRALTFPCLFQHYHGIFYNIGMTTTVLTAVLFNRLLFGMSVDKEHARLELPREQECNRQSCIQTPLIIVTCFTAVACVLFIIVHLRYYRFVRRHHARRLEIEGEGGSGGDGNNNNHNNNNYGSSGSGGAEEEEGVEGGRREHEGPDSEGQQRRIEG